MSRLAVYTAITEGYDRLCTDLEVQKGVDYICFTDEPQQSSIWQMRTVEDRRLSQVKLARKIKILASQYLPDYDFTVWVDGNVTLRADPYDLVERYGVGEAPIALFAHPHRSCIYEEVDACINMGKVDAENAWAQISVYRQEEYPPHNGLVATMLLVRRKDEKLHNFEQAWWAQVREWTHRDQLSFNYVAWRLGFPYTIIPGDPFTSPDIAQVGSHVQTWSPERTDELAGSIGPSGDLSS